MLFSSLLNIKRLFGYAMIGLGSTIIHILIASITVWLVDASLILSNIAGFSCAFIFSYYFQSRKVFRRELSLILMAKYLVVQLSALAISIFLAHLLQSVNIYIQIILVAVMLPLVTYVVHSLWTFSDRVDSHV